jgi:vacuolar-type H+-ATPase subunit I/STV1
MDVLAIAVAAGGLMLTANGHTAVGVALVVCALTALAVGFVRDRHLATILPFSFDSNFPLTPLCVVAAVVLQHRAAASLCLLGLPIYHYGCVSLAERKYRYLPWGLGWSWRTVEKAHLPILYWVLIALCFGLAALFLGGALGALAGWLPLTDGRSQ